jgi:hypothetical protein
MVLETQAGWRSTHGVEGRLRTQFCDKTLLMTIKKTANLCNSQANFFPLSEKPHNMLIYLRITSAGSHPADV